MLTHSFTVASHKTCSVIQPIDEAAGSVCMCTFALLLSVLVYTEDEISPVFWEDEYYSV